ncbi:MAG: alpha-E domain-containing protein [Gammaproteobacteria bacterium]
MTLEAVLLNQASLNTHRRRYRALQQVMTVLDLLLLDVQHPRSLAYQVEQISQKLAKLPPLTKPLGSHQLSREQRLILQVSTDLKLAEAEKLSRLTEDTNTRIHLDKLLNNVERRLSKISALLTEKYFSHTQSARQLAPTRIELSV